MSGKVTVLPVFPPYKPAFTCPRCKGHALTPTGEGWWYFRTMLWCTQCRVAMDHYIRTNW